jgi:hypothetical protein
MNAMFSPCDRLRALLDSAASDDVIAALITEHGATCPRCREDEHALASVAARLRISETDVLPPAVETRLMARLCESLDAKTSLRG